MDARKMGGWSYDDLAPSTLGMEDALDGEDVVPGFLHPISSIFADPLA